MNQRKYALELLEETGFLAAKLVSFPMDTNIKLSKDDLDPLPDPTSYRSLVGKLLYLTVTRPDIAFPVHTLAQFMSSPCASHLLASQRVLRYIKGIMSHGIFFSRQLDPKLRGLQ